MDKNSSSLLSKAKIEVSPETYSVISLMDKEWQSLLENPELSPRMTTPFMIFKDKWEITLVLDEVDYQTVKHVIREAKVEKNFRLLSFDVELPFDVVGFMAHISEILANAGISILPISSFSRDHVLISQHDLAEALKALRDHVDEIC
ncbi:MAG: ACT domain-containing protein [Pyrinomonadaceae bacterium]|nr:ACT domain-containing protein [Pyrinomonadaceae bacterium]